MQPFPLIEALWASLDPERPSGDDPPRVVLALSQFYADFQRAYMQGRKQRWRTPLFREKDNLLRERLEQALALTTDLAANFSRSSPLLDDLRRLDPEIRQAVSSLEAEEKTFGIAPNASPKLMQFDYLFEGWSRGLLDAEPVETFLTEFLKAATGTRNDIAGALKTGKRHERESAEETSAIEQATTGVDAIERDLRALLDNLPRGAAACRPLRDAVMGHGRELGQSFQRLEQVAPPTEPCPFCGGNLSLSGRCRSCGRRLPHLEEVEIAEGEFQAQSPFLSNNLRKVDLALSAFDNDPDNEDLWREFQDAVRAFGKQVDAGKQQVEMLSSAQDRPIDPDSSERLAERELTEISAVFMTAYRALSTFAFTPFPPESDLPDDWREPLLAAEPRLQALENRYAPPSEDDDSALPTP